MYQTKTFKEGRVWGWSVLRDGETIAGGYCRTRADARNDAGIYAGILNARLTNWRAA